MAKKPTWSFSALNSFENCPHKHNETRIAKRIQDEWGKEAKEGDEIHKKLEASLKGGGELQGALSQFEVLVKRILSSPGELHPETKFCITREMKPTHYTDWAKGWFRAIIDILIVFEQSAWIGDWKTGKVKNDYDQLELFAAVVFLFYPKVNLVKANYIWLKTNELSPTQEYTREEVPEIWQKHLPRALALESAFYSDTWPTKVSGLCKSYCVINKLGRCPNPDVPKHILK